MYILQLTIFAIIDVNMANFCRARQTLLHNFLCNYADDKQHSKSDSTCNKIVQYSTCNMSIRVKITQFALTIIVYARKFGMTKVIHQNNKYDHADYIIDFSHSI